MTIIHCSIIFSHILYRHSHAETIKTNDYYARTQRDFGSFTRDDFCLQAKSSLPAFYAIMHKKYV